MGGLVVLIGVLLVVLVVLLVLQDSRVRDRRKGTHSSSTEARSTSTPSVGVRTSVPAMRLSVSDIAAGVCAGLWLFLLTVLATSCVIGGAAILVLRWINR